ncbi:HNH endonuclease signature motif containing protein [Amnibacterium setariae]|uniref:HNH endonuclease n=1 Tax=Amnibacterium setariae TaxID=2306585 RepID=A0A3A1TTQ0_9MICO|nr:HNH endonuclease signature motif containing protein [Amnibacterium setariae]RIX27602.1 HNH endonuclease [Amnibacterium setariae]
MFEEFPDDEPPRVWTREEADAWDALAEEDRLAQLPPDERYREQFGPDAVPDDAWLAAALTEDAAVYTQDLAVQADRMRIIADAHRIAALLTAYERAMIDLAHRFGTAFGTRAGLGAQTFFRTFGLQIGAHPAAVAGEVDTGLILRDRLPLTWAVFQAGDASWSRMRTVVREAEGLGAEHWAAYDEIASMKVVISTRLKDDLRKARARLDDEAAAKRARTTYERRRTSLELGHDGGVAFVAEGLAADWVPINDALHKAAVAAHGVDGETRGIAQLRHDIALDLLRAGLQTPASDGALVPDRKTVQVQLILTVPALAWLGKTKEQAQLTGYGPIDLETAKALAGAAASFIRVLTDPVTGVRLTMDRKVYAPPADLARWVRIRDGRSRFPGSTIAPHLADIDHAREWQHGGTTDAANLVTLGRTDHNLKSAGLFIEGPVEDDGTVGWNEAWGHHFADPPNDPLDPAPPELLPPPADEGPCPF